MRSGYAGSVSFSVASAGHRESGSSSAPGMWATANSSVSRTSMRRGGTGMHEGFLPGYPASHGCIRMPGRMAEIFFNNVSVGTPVTVTN